jgi:hypothetical protein
MYATVEAGSLGGSGVEASEAPLMQLNSAGPDLVRRLREGAEIAYREFVERYQSEVYRVAYGIMGHRIPRQEIGQCLLCGRLSRSTPGI